MFAALVAESEPARVAYRRLAIFVERLLGPPGSPSGGAAAGGLQISTTAEAQPPVDGAHGVDGGDNRV